MFEFSMNILNK